VIQFRNTHLVYALTWFALAALSGAAAVLVLRTGRR
jgi:surfeit locus 1 family protein